MIAQTTEKMRGWLAGRLPQDWFEADPEVTVDRDEVVIVGRLAAPAVNPEASDAQQEAAESGRIQQFREDTREGRMEIARDLERAADRKVAWGAECGDSRQVFTSLSAPVMTRLRQSERKVLDTLVDAGVARSRSDALAWCVRLVAKNTETWLADLRTAMEDVAQIRQQGPDAT